MELVLDLVDVWVSGSVLGLLGISPSIEVVGSGGGSAWGLGRSELPLVVVDVSLIVGDGSLGLGHLVGDLGDIIISLLVHPVSLPSAPSPVVAVGSVAVSEGLADEE